MRLLVGLVALIALFALLVYTMPGSWALPLYILFVALTIAYTGWERRRIAQKRSKLERQLLQERREFAQRQKQGQADDEDLAS